MNKQITFSNGLQLTADAYTGKITASSGDYETVWKYWTITNITELKKNGYAEIKFAHDDRRIHSPITKIKKIKY